MKIIVSLVKLLRRAKSPSLAKTTAQKIKPKCLTNSYRDAVSNNLIMDRKINFNGEKALMRIETLPDGTRKLNVITDNGYIPITRTKNIQRETGSSVFGGNKITISQETTHRGAFKDTFKLEKEYSPDGALEHKVLDWTHDSGNGLNDYTRHAVQDKAFAEVQLTSSIKNMLEAPKTNQTIKHALDKTDNYHYFKSGANTKYTQTIAKKEQEIIDAKKAAEAKALAEKEVLEKAMAERLAKQPRINISKVLNQNIDDLTVQEIPLPNGGVKRIFSDPTTGKALAITEDIGILHKEWIYGGKADLIFMKQIKNETPYIVSKKGKYTQIKTLVEDKPQTIQYYSNNDAALLRRVYSNGNPTSTEGYVKVYDETASAARERYPQFADEYPDIKKVRIHNSETVGCTSMDYIVPSFKKAKIYVKELDLDAKQNCIDFEDLFKPFES